MGNAEYMGWFGGRPRHDGRRDGPRELRLLFRWRHVLLPLEIHVRGVVLPGQDLRRVSARGLGRSSDGRCLPKCAKRGPGRARIVRGLLPPALDRRGVLSRSDADDGAAPILVPLPRKLSDLGGAARGFSLPFAVSKE